MQFVEGDLETITKEFKVRDENDSMQHLDDGESLGGNR
jgi:hypothetical protein